MGAAFSKKDVRLLIAGLDAAGKTSAPAPCRSPPPPRRLERASCLAAAILYKLKKGQKQVHANVSTIPTLNFNVENCRYGKIRFSVWVRVEPEADRLLTQPASRRAPLLRCTAERAPPALPDSRACTTPPRLPSPPAQDVGGQDSIRSLWRHYYTGTQGLIYVVDSNDRDRVRKAAEELHKMVLDHEMRCATAWPARPTPAPSALLSAPAARAPRRIRSTSLISISPPFGFGAIRRHHGILDPCSGARGPLGSRSIPKVAPQIGSDAAPVGRPR